MRLALAAGEISGDLLGAGLLRTLLERQDDLLPAGIGGPALARAGCRIWQPMEPLSVMGLWEVLGRLPELLRIRRRFLHRLEEWKPDLYLGIDAPDFNFPVEARMRRLGIPTVHYVSPSVWAWREKRVEKIRESTSHVLCLFPFEPKFYARHGVEATFVGHPFAHQIPLQPDRQAARNRLALDEEHRWLALLPGSRMGEIRRLGPLFLQAVRHMLVEQPQLAFMLPATGKPQQELLNRMIRDYRLEGRVLCVRGHARCIMQACEVGLIASGTAALEAMLCKLPMVVSYRVHPATAQLIRMLRLMRTRWFSLPNILNGEPLVDELIQHHARPEALARATLELLQDTARQRRQRMRFLELHRQLACDSDRRAAQVILELAGQ